MSEPNDALRLTAPGQLPSVGELELIFRTSLTGIVIADELGNVKSWNDEAERLFGWSSAEISGLSLAETIVPPRFRAAHTRGMRHYMETGEGPVLGQVLELAAMHRDGREFPIELSISPASHNGDRAVFIAFIRDISERRRRESSAALRSEVTEILARSVDVDHMAEAVLKAMSVGMGWILGQFWTVDGGVGRLRHQAAWVAESVPAVEAFVGASRKATLVRGRGLPGRVWERGLPAIIEDVTQDANFPRSLNAFRAGLHGALGFPVIAATSNEVVAVMEFFSAAPGKLDQELMDLMASIGSQIGQFLDRVESDQRGRAVLENVADGIVTLDTKGRIQSFNRSARNLTGYSSDEVIGTSIDTLIAQGRQGDFLRYFKDRLRPGKESLTSGSHETLGRRKDGTSFPMEFLATDMRLGGRRVFIASLRDISERKAHTAALEYQAMHDSLTGLPNRVLFGDRLRQEILSATREKRTAGLLVLDINRFKDVNDTLGHHAGDKLLEAFGERLKGALRAADTVARLGGDEFAILPHGITGPHGLVATANKVVAALEAPFVIEEVPVYAAASIGIANFPEHGLDAASLARRADVAMYVAKQSHLGFMVYATDQEGGAERRLALLGELRHAIAHDELVLHYQPKVSISTARTVGVEALVRWAHPQRGLLSPDKFIPLAEVTELIGPLTRWVLQEAISQIETWDMAGLALNLSVNLSAANLLDAEIVGYVTELLGSSGIDPQRLTLEITESQALADSVDDTLRPLRELGVGLSLDDFGTGFASFTYVRRLPLTELKLDRSFVSGMALQPEDAALVRPSISLGHSLQLVVVAEGVEDRATWDILAGYGCDCAQGYFLSPGLPASELKEWLTRSPWGLWSTQELELSPPGPA